MKRPLVSVLTPTYNQERYLGATLESVLAQSYDNWEVIVLDDCSTDGTFAVAQEYARRDPRVKALRNPENRGIYRLSENYATMLEHASGELVAILDGDDTWPAHKLERQVQAHLAGGAPLSFGQTQYIDERGGPLPVQPYPQFPRGVEPQQLFRDFVRSDFYMGAVTVIVDRSALEQIGGFQQPPYLPMADMPTWLRIGALGRGFTYIPEVLGNWRQTNGQTSWQMARTMALRAYQHSREFLASHPVKGLTQKDLLSPGRRSYLADSSYRSALMAWEGGKSLEAWQYALETLRWQPRVFFRCMAAFAFKSLRKLGQGEGPQRNPSRGRG